MKLCPSAVRFLILILGVLLAQAALSQRGMTLRVSVSSTGAQVRDRSERASISGDGRYVAFHSEASDLVQGDTNGTFDVFVHDRRTGATERVSVGSDGRQGNGPSGGYSSRNASISADGRFIAFWSLASNLVEGDTNGTSDVFVHDRQSGRTYRVSVSTDGIEGNNWSWAPSMSADGRYVAFSSSASNLVSGDTNGVDDTFVHDLQTGQTTRVSVNDAGQQGDGASTFCSISADGRYIAYQSQAQNLVPDDTNFFWDVFVYDQQTRDTSRVSLSNSGEQGNGYSWYPSISGDGHYVGFESLATNLVQGDTNNHSDVFLRDRQTGQTLRVSLSSSGEQGNGDSFSPSISSDGRHIAFLSAATNLVEHDINLSKDVFVHDQETGLTSRVSVSSSGQQGDLNSYEPDISANGRYVAFPSDATQLVEHDTNAFRDIFVHQYLADYSSSLPESITVFRGVLEAGGLAEVLASDDQYMIVRSGAVALRTESPVMVVATYTCLAQLPEALDVRWENRVSIHNLVQRLEMRNYITGAFVEIDRREASTTDSVATVHVPNPTEYVEFGPRTMQTRHRIEPLGPVFTSTWRTYIDEISILELG